MFPYICAVKAVKNIFLLASALILFGNLYSQNDSIPRMLQKPKLIDKFFFGGNIGLQLGNYTYIHLSPVAGYHINRRFNVGAGITYIYMSYGAQKANLIGGKVFTQGFIWQGLFGHVEYELINYPDNVSNNPTVLNVRNNANSLFVGIGYQQSFGRRSFSQVMLLYNVIYDRNNSPYSNPFALRFMFGF